MNNKSVEKQSLGRRLICFAWLVEVFAVLTGLLIALIIGYDSFMQMSQATNYKEYEVYSQVIIAVLPFIVIAMLELSKIPLAQAAYMKGNPLFYAALVILAVITFETMINGLERSFTGQTYSVDSKLRELESYKLEKEAVTNQLDSMTKYNSRVDISAKLTDEYEQARREHQNRLTPIEREISELNSSMADVGIEKQNKELSLISKRKAELKQEYQNELEEIKKEYKEARNKMSGNTKFQVKHIDEQILAAKKEISSLKNEKEKRVKSDSGFFNKKSTIREPFNKKIITLERKVTVLNEKKEKLIIKSDDESLATKYQKSRGALKARSQSMLSEQSKKEDSIHKEISLVMGENKRLLSKKILRLEIVKKGLMDRFSEIEREIGGKKEIYVRRYEREDSDKLQKEGRLVELESGISQAKDDINKAVSKVQIYRLAQNWYGKDSAADLSRTEVANIATIWFGSLAFIIATMGIILALAGEMVRSDRNPKRVSIRFLLRKVYYGLRQRAAPGRPARKYLGIRKVLAAIYKKKARTKIKLIEKEVPLEVEKIIYRTVEVPKEIPVNKIVIKEVIKEIPVNKIVFKEVPKEVVHKKFVYVPFYTNDPKLLNTQGEEQELLKDTDMS